MPGPSALSNATDGVSRAVAEVFLNVLRFDFTEVQGDVEGEFVVQAGRTDTITDPAMYSEDREARKRRAEYVHAAVDGRNVTSGEETTVPVPRSDDGVVKLLDRLDADREEVRRIDIEELEAQIDRAVYDLCELTEDEREAVEDYLDVF
jgi:predicted DNA binding protein